MAEKNRSKIRSGSSTGNPVPTRASFEKEEKSSPGNPLEQAPDTDPLKKNPKKFFNRSASFNVSLNKRAMADYLDLSQFHLRPQEGDKPYWVFDPKSDAEYDQLAEFLHVDEIAAKILTEGEAHLKQAGGGLEPGEQADWSKIYKVTLSDPGTDAELKTEKGETIYVFMAVMVKEGRFTKFWAAFLCSKKNSKHLFADQSIYDSEVREALRAGHTPLHFGGAN